MDYSVPGYLTPFIVSGMVAIVAAVLFGINRGLGRTASPGRQWPQKDGDLAISKKAFWSLSALLVAWFVMAFATSLSGFYRPPAGSAPTIQWGLLTPIVVGLLLFLSWPLLRRTLAIIPNSWIVGVQLYRTLGVVFLLLYAGGHLPGLFALPAGIFDVLVGILAPIVAAAYARSPEGASRSVRFWNLLGITDLVVAVGLGFVTSPSPFQLAAFDHPNQLIGMFPLVLIPVFAVPLSILLHLASLQKLRQDQAQRYKPAAAPRIESSARQVIG
jgi:hypothetical protein